MCFYWKNIIYIPGTPCGSQSTSRSDTIKKRNNHANKKPSAITKYQLTCLFGPLQCLFTVVSVKAVNVLDWDFPIVEIVMNTLNIFEDKYDTDGRNKCFVNYASPSNFILTSCNIWKYIPVLEVNLMEYVHMLMLNDYTWNICSNTMIFNY